LDFLAYIVERKHKGKALNSRYRRLNNRGDGLQQQALFLKEALNPIRPVTSYPKWQLINVLVPGIRKERDVVITASCFFYN